MEMAEELDFAEGTETEHGVVEGGDALDGDLSLGRDMESRAGEERGEDETERGEEKGEGVERRTRRCHRPPHQSRRGPGSCCRRRRRTCGRPWRARGRAGGRGRRETRTIRGRSWRASKRIEYNINIVVAVARARPARAARGTWPGGETLQSAIFPLLARSSASPSPSPHPSLLPPVQAPPRPPPSPSPSPPSPLLLSIQPSTPRPPAHPPKMPAADAKRKDHESIPDSARDAADRDRDRERDKGPKQKPSAKGTSVPPLPSLSFLHRLLSSPPPSQGPLPCPVQIFQSRLLHRRLFLPLLPSDPRTRPAKGGLRLVRQGQLQVRPQVRPRSHSTRPEHVHGPQEQEGRPTCRQRSRRRVRQGRSKILQEPQALSPRRTRSCPISQSSSLWFHRSHSSSHRQCSSPDPHASKGYPLSFRPCSPCQRYGLCIVWPPGRE